MGGRGAKLGKYYLGGKWHTYGDEYKTLLKSGNIKFVTRRDNKQDNVPMETMTKGRVYVTVNKRTNKLLNITYYDNENDGLKGATRLTIEEKKMVERVIDLWDNKDIKSKSR